MKTRTFKTIIAGITLIFTTVAILITINLWVQFIKGAPFIIMPVVIPAPFNVLVIIMTTLLSLMFVCVSVMILERLKSL